MYKMRRLSLLAFFHIIFFNGICQIGIGTSSPNTSAALDITSNTKGFLPPRMTAAQRTAISSPAEGLLVFQTNETTGLWFYSGGKWNIVPTTQNEASSSIQQTKIGFSASGTWTCPTGVTQITVELWGGGGGAASAAWSWSNYFGCCFEFNGAGPYWWLQTLNGGQGGNGGYIKATLSVIPNTVYNVIVGSGGSGGGGQESQV